MRKYLPLLLVILGLITLKVFSQSVTLTPSTTLTSLQSQVNILQNDINQIEGNSYVLASNNGSDFNNLSITLNNLLNSSVVKTNIGSAIIPSASYKIVNNFAVPAATTTVLYTAPANTRTLLERVIFIRGSYTGATIDAYLTGSVSGTDREITTDTNITGITGTAPVNLPIILEPSQTIKAVLHGNTTSGNMSILLYIVEFPNTVPFKSTVTVLASTGTDETIYSNTSGNYAQIMDINRQFNAVGGIFVLNNTGSNLSYVLNYVPNAGSASVQNAISTNGALFSGAALNTATANGVATMQVATGDKLSLNTTGTAGSIVCVNSYEQ